MNCYTKTLSVKGGGFPPRFIGLMFGVISLCFACLASAGSSVDLVITESSFAKDLAGSGNVPEVEVHLDAISDIDLSTISGMGAEPTKLEGSDMFAVLLWDERGNGNRRTAGHDVDGSQIFQAVNLTVNRR